MHKRLIAALLLGSVMGMVAAPSVFSLDGNPAAANPPGADGRVHAVKQPVLQVFPTATTPSKGKVLLLPGGGYQILAVGHEGAAVAEFLNRQGYDAAMLEYTIAAGDGTRDRALGDALAAWRLLAETPAKLGLGDSPRSVMGFSAGGHLAARLCAILPEIEQPFRAILIYPAYLDETLPGTRIPAVSPPTGQGAALFTLIAANDKAAWVAGCREYSAAWGALGRRSQIEVLAGGGHGFGMKPDLPGAAKQWPDLLAVWLQAPKWQPRPVVVPPGASCTPVPQPGCAKRHEEKLAAVAAKKFDLIMLGDSITHNFEKPEFQPVWNQFFAPRNALNLGYSGARTENILWNIQHGELDGQAPKVITLMIGTNNADAANYPTHHNGVQIGDGIRVIVHAIQEKCPAAKILLLRCFPGAYGGPGPTSHRVALDRASESALDLAGDGQVFFCDVNHVFLNLDGSIKQELMPDWLHPNAEGAKRWAQAMEPMLSQLFGDASRDPDPPKNPAIIPAPNVERDSYNWLDRHAEVMRNKRTHGPEIVLIGDSITHFWGGEPAAKTANGPKTYAAVFAPYRVLNLGFGWDRTQNVLWRLDHGELDGLHPRAVIINIGTNNTSRTAAARANSPAEIVAGIAAICERVRSKAPTARIILTQVFPREETADHPTRRTIGEINRLLVGFAKQHHLDVIDPGSRMPAPDGTLPRSLLPDLCHPNEAGYQLWADALRPHLPQPPSR